MSELLTRETLTELLNVAEQPCLSLYMPTHRAFPEREQDPIRFRNLLRELRDQVQNRFPEEQHDELMRGFEAYQDDRDFWNNPRGGVAMLGGRDFFKVFTLYRSVPERAIANVHPHIAPLLRIIQSADQYQVLALSRDEVRLFEGNRDQLIEVELAAGVPKNIVEALGSDLTAGDQSGRPDGFGAASERGDPFQHESGGSGKQDEIDSDRNRFFRAVDRAIIEHHSKPSGLPLLLAALPENQAVFRDLSHNQQLVEGGIAIDQAALDIRELQNRCWEVMATQYSSRLDGLLDQYGAARGKGLAGDDLGEIGRASISGRVATLLVEADRVQPGKLDHASGKVTLQSGEAGKPDVLDELALHAMRNGADVVIVPTERMPCRSGAAAVYRF
ncbi:baeRF3 domain-containing protein [Pseudomonas sp.]|jgi:hypothetical protein|uniref:baeRF3 domain-containing protein n=1 Tax=Pseudomonas sp. TaxID=306 RepID=UPI0027295062|nr:hypothetical protein [Pseudomonas sp.]